MNSQNNTALVVLKSNNYSGTVKIALYNCKISAGFPSPADDYIDKHLDLNEHLIKRQASTYLLIASGDSMTGENIHDRDMLIVDRSIKPISGDVVIAVVDGQLTVKKLFIDKNNQIFLEPANHKYQRIQISESMELVIWGVVLHVVHSYQR